MSATPAPHVPGAHTAGPHAPGPDSLAARAPGPLLHVVLHQPEIPNNTGNIGRTCVATRAALHLVHPLGFDVSEKACRRAGLDYWPRLDVRHYADWNAYLRAADSPAPRRWYFHTPGPRGGRCVFDVDLRPGDHLVFGCETRGLPADILDPNMDRIVYLPMVPGERSLNLATAVCTVVYEAIRQMLAHDAMTLDAHGRLVDPPETPVTRATDGAGQV